MSQKVIVALYDHYADARAAVSDIMQAGIPGGDIALLANDSNGDHPGLSINPAFAREQFDEDSQKQSRFITLGEVGIGLGGLLGLLLTTISPVPIPGHRRNWPGLDSASSRARSNISDRRHRRRGDRAHHRPWRHRRRYRALFRRAEARRHMILVTAHVPEGAAAKTKEGLKKRSPAKLEERPRRLDRRRLGQPRCRPRRRGADRRAGAGVIAGQLGRGEIWYRPNHRLQPRPAGPKERSSIG